MTMNPDDKAVPLTQEEGNVAIIQGHDGPQLVQGKQSHRCYGCCCDCLVKLWLLLMSSAVNVVSLCQTVLAIFLIYPFLHFTPLTPFRKDSKD